MSTAQRTSRYVGENLMSQGRNPLETINGNIQTRGIGNEIGDRPLRKGRDFRPISLRVNIY